MGLGLPNACLVAVGVFEIVAAPALATRQYTLAAVGGLGLVTEANIYSRRRQTIVPSLMLFLLVLL